MYDTLFLENGDLLESVNISLELLNENNIGIIKRRKIIKDASKYYKIFSKYGDDYNDNASNALFNVPYFTSHYLLYLYDKISIKNYNEVIKEIKEINKDLCDYKLRITKATNKNDSKYFYRIGIYVDTENLNSNTIYC